MIALAIESKRMDIRKITLGLGSFALGTVALAAAAVLGDSYARNRKPSTGEKGTGGGDASEPLAAKQPAPEPAPAPQAPAAPPAPAASSAGNAEHVPTDLMGDRHPGPNDRAPDAFRPDPTAPVPDSEREGLRPATGPAPTLVAGHSDDRI